MVVVKLIVVEIVITNGIVGLGRVIDSSVGMNVIAKEDPKHYYYLYSSL